MATAGKSDCPGNLVNRRILYRQHLRRALDAQRAFQRLDENLVDARRIRVKFGIHRGPAILVNLNGRIDYFGATVNKAARIQDAAAPNELVFSSEVRGASEVADSLLEDEGVHFQEEQITLKGINSDQVIFRIAGAGPMVLSPSVP